MRLLKAVSLILLIVAAVAENPRMYCHMRGTILCNGEPVDNVRIEMMEAGDSEADHDHLGTVRVRAGEYDLVATTVERTISFWFWVQNYPTFFLRVHHQCGDCGDPQDISWCDKANQYEEPWKAMDKALDSGDVELSQCRKN